MIKNKFNLKKRIKDDLYKKEKNNIVKNIYDLYTMGIKIFVPFLIVFFGLLDYWTFTKIFNFNHTAFLDVYIFSISLSNASLIIVILLLPVIILLLIYVIAIIGASPVFFITKVKDKQLNEPFLFFIFMSILLLSSLGILHIELLKSNILFYCMSAVAPIFIAYLFVTLYDLYFNNSNKIFIILSLSLLCGFGGLMLYYGHSNIQEYILYLLLIIMIPTIHSYIFAEFFLIKSLKKVSIKDTRPIVFFIAVFFFISVLSFTLLHNSNTDIWNNSINDQNSTTNLFLNKKFLSKISPYDDILLSKTKEINEIKITKETKYLPISSNMKLYFVFQKDKNNTKVFAIEKKYYKDKYIFNILDSGCINCPKNISKPNKNTN
ncbi:hypothetical protein [Sulfurimonas sp.]|uniref:hypothetical protein n=1 Tax=Sulfurimonas sp. TaxID=2022749 RepID=UPI002AAF8412|nr:hypothetical protein [Sulfurimonas sp.]